MIDEEISRIVRDSQRIADEILRKNIEILHRIAQELLKYETIDSIDLEKILKGEKLTRALNGQNKPKNKRKPRKRQNKPRMKDGEKAQKNSRQKSHSKPQQGKAKPKQHQPQKKQDVNS
jgi:hypothetical protein